MMLNYVEISHTATVYYSSYKPTKSTWKKILKKLKDNTGICVVKGNFVVILDKPKYKERIFELLSDTTKFKILYKDPTFYCEGQLQQRFLICKKRCLFHGYT